jgi:hypothetical protein
MGIFGQNTASPNFSTQQRLCLASVPTTNTTAGGWQQWHQSLVKCFGRAGANDIWMIAWERYGRRNPNAYSTSLAQYMQGQGVTLTTSGGESLALAGANFMSSVGGYFNFMKILNIVVVGGIAVGFLMLLYNLIMNPEKAKKTLGVVTEGAMLATPAGRVASVGTKSLPQ